MILILPMLFSLKAHFLHVGMLRSLKLAKQARISALAYDINTIPKSKYLGVLCEVYSLEMHLDLNQIHSSINKPESPFALNHASMLTRLPCAGIIYKEYKLINYTRYYSAFRRMWELCYLAWFLMYWLLFNLDYLK